MRLGEWQRKNDFYALAAFICRQGRLDPRRERLWAVAVCRLWMEKFPAALGKPLSEMCKKALNAAEQLADNETITDSSQREYTRLQNVQTRTILGANAFQQLVPDLFSYTTTLDMVNTAVYHSEDFPPGTMIAGIFGIVRRLPADQQAYFKESLSNLLRDIFRHPAQPVITLNPSWLTSTVLALSQGIYQEKAFDRMPILADALQDAGCDNEDILNHCRQPGTHTRGCWVVDTLLGIKEQIGTPCRMPPRPRGGHGGRGG